MKNTKKLALFTTLIILSCIFLFTLTSCQGARVNFEELNYLEGVSMTADRTAFLTSEKEIKIVWKNTSESFLSFGDYFYLVKKNNNSWRKLSTKANVGYYDIAYDITPGGESPHTYKLQSYYRNLKEGTYRIVTDYYAGGGTLTGNSPHKYSIYIEITLTKDIAT